MGELGGLFVGVLVCLHVASVLLSGSLYVFLYIRLLLICLICLAVFAFLFV